MISLPLSVLLTFRAVARRSGLLKKRATNTVWTLVATADSCRLRIAAGDVALEYRHDATYAAETLTLPTAALDLFAGRGEDLVVFQSAGERGITVAWADRGIPRQAAFEAPKPPPHEFPEVPSHFRPNEPGLWQALRDALPVTDRESSRFALGCLHLRGKLGRIDATDGRHVLTQAGFHFGWPDDVLLPANNVLGCRELDLGAPVGIGHQGDWIGFSVENWLVMVAVQKEGRFPKIDDILPDPATSPSRLELSPADAAFLSEALPRLPNENPAHDPITVDLNGRVLIRARESATARPAEIELLGSKFVGEPVVWNTNRRYLDHAIRLGFKTLHARDAKSPVLGADERRRFLWCLLNAEDAIPRHDDPVRISPESSARRPVNRIKSTTPNFHPVPLPEAPMSVPMAKQQVAASTTAATPHDAKPVKRTRPRLTVSTIEQAVVLRDALRGVARQAGELVRSLKQQKRQARIVASTLASLKELQKVAG